MTHGIRPEQVWGIGLPSVATTAISAALGSGFTLRNFSPGQLPGDRDLDRATPIVIFIDKDAWRAMPPAAGGIFLVFSSLQSTYSRALSPNKQNTSYEIVPHHSARSVAAIAPEPSPPRR